MSKIHWISFAAIALASFAVFMIIRTRGAKSRPQVTVAQVDSDIRDHLPIGCSRQEVVAYLDQKKIGHSYVDELKESPEYNHTEMALIRGASRTWLIRGDIQILFRFDEGGKLASYSVKEIFTGP